MGSMLWNCCIMGPENTPYHEGIFFIEVRFPVEYPFKPPKVKFTTKIYHMNINEDGGIFHNMLKEGWTPTITIHKVLQMLHGLFITPITDNPLVAEIAALYLSDKDAHDKKAKEYTLKFAA